MRTWLVQWALRFKNHQSFTWLLLKAVWVIFLRYPWFGYLEYTVRAKAQTDNSTATGCPNGNQCVRVQWQPQRKRRAAAVWPQNKGNSFPCAVQKKAA